MKSLLNRINDKQIIVADGAMGTMLFQRGLKVGECPELMNLEHPEAVIEIARIYLKAGAEIIQTNTFGGSPIKLSEYGLEDKCAELTRLAVEHVRSVVGTRAYVSGSCGPVGKLLKPYGDLTTEEVRDSFISQISALIESGVDLICVETMTDLREAVLAVEAAKSIDPDIPVMATMVFDKKPNGFFTIMGDALQASIQGLEVAGADILGSNCGNGIDIMTEIAIELNELTDKPTIIQANAGQPELMEGELVYPESPAYFASVMPRLIDAGVAVFGGCCGTTPEHIKAIRSVVDQQKN